MKRLFLLAVCPVWALAQPVTFGAKLGLPANQFLDTVESANINFRSYTNKYLIGGTGEVHLPFGLGIEVDALYRHYNFQTTGMLVPAGTTITAGGSTGAWEFPLLAKYRFPTRLARPYIDVGAAWDTLQGFKQAITIVSPVPIFPPKNLNQPAHNTATGVVIGAGIDIKVPYVHVSPEFRFTHWTTQHFVPGAPTLASGNIFPGFTAATGFSTSQNQAEVMVGVTF